MKPFDKAYRKNISSDNVFRQIWGALVKYWVLALLFLITLLMGVYPSYICDLWSIQFASLICKIIWMVCITLFGTLSIIVCDTLTEVNGLLRKEKRITWFQIGKLIVIGIWICCVIFILGIQKETKSTVVIGLIGSVLAWIFQDKIKGAVSFIHLRMNHLLNIGDWIMVPKLEVDGEVKKVTLTTVTLYNWDTTTSTFPISALQSEHFMNLQNMADGKTYGRKMLKSFILETGSVHPITVEELEQIKADKHEILKFLPGDEIKTGVLNAHLFRLYIYYWLMNNPDISQKPRLIVRWVDHKECGLTLEVYAFLVDSDFATFEWQQSQIMEHIITAIDWFNLRLYQSPSSYDVSKSDIHIDNPEILIKEQKQ